MVQGTKNTFVGMDLEFKNDKAEITMNSYLQEAINAFPEKIENKVSSPASDHLYVVNQNGKR